MKRLQMFYYVSAICFFAGVTLTQAGESDFTTSSFDIVAVFLETFTFGFLIFFSYVRRDALLRNVRYLAGPLPLVLMTIFSTIWSLHPPFTFRRSLVLLAGTFFGYHLGAVFKPDQVIAYYRRAFLVMMAFSCTVIVLLPRYGISHDVHAGDWKGSFPHKNRLGAMMALTFITFIVSPTTRLSRKVAWSIGVVALGLIYKSHSGTAISIVALVIVLALLKPLLHKRRKVLLAISLNGLPILALVITGLIAISQTLLGLLGKDATFTGRTPLWIGVLHAIGKRPLLGYGYLAYFQQPEGVPVLIAELTSFKTIHSHNGFLNLMIHVGAVGLAIFLVFYLRVIWKTILEVRRTNSVEARWFLCFLIYMTTLNLVESQLLEPFYFNWVTLTAMSISLARRRRENRRPAILEAESVEQSELVAVS